MSDQPQSGRFKPEMPQVPAFSGLASRQNSAGWPLRAIGLGLLVVVVSLVGIRWLLRTKPSDPASVAPFPQIEVPSPAADPNAALPHISETQPAITTVREMTRPWSHRQFFYRKGQTGESIPALLIRLPSSSPAQPAGYWALSMQAPSGNYNLEYIRDWKKLKIDYGFRAATHPMVGNPCSRTLFDPLKIMNLPGNVWVRGAIVQGSDLRPPLGIEVNIVGKEILAARME